MNNEETKKKKIVNLCEDGNEHEHNEASYQKMMEHQKGQE